MWWDTDGDGNLAVCTKNGSMEQVIMPGQHFALPPLSIYVTHTHTLSLSMRFRDVDDVLRDGPVCADRLCANNS